MSLPLTGTQKTGLGAWGGLFLLQVLWYSLYPPVSIPTWVAFVITVPPLLLPLLSLPRVTRALLWVGVLALFYFCHGVVAAWIAPAGRLPALIESFLCVVVIGSLGWSVRRDKARRAARSTK